MSISTGSICSFGDYDFSSTSSMAGKPTPVSGKVVNDPSAHGDTLRDAQLAGWCDEIKGKICVYDGDIDSYLRTFLPSRTPCLLDAPATALSENFVPAKGKELASYTPLLEIFRALVARFPADKKPSFYGGHDQVMPFPFAEFAGRHHESKPDLAMSFPGILLAEKIESPNWSQFSMAMEVKDLVSKDPFARSSRTDYSAALAHKLVQLAVNARGLMFANGFLASFMLGIYGDVVRIARFDHACCVASAPVSLKTAEGLRAVQEFFWRFVHPWEGEPGAVVGSDPTIRNLTPADTTWLRERLGSDANLLDDVDIDEARWVKVWDDDKPADPRAFILFRLLDVNARLFSRSTMVWLGIEDVRFRNRESNAKMDEPVELRVIKEAWRQVIRIPEQKFYTRLKEEIPDEERIGLPDLLCGGDLGERDVKRWEAACTGKAWCDDDDLLDARSVASDLSTASEAATDASSLFSAASARSSNSSTSSLSHTDANGPADGDQQTASESMPQVGQPDIPYPMHQTWSSRLGMGPTYHANERSHMRFVMDTVGRPLSRFKTTKELVMALRDAIVGHQLAMERAGVLHRDVSSGNILIVDRVPVARPISHGVLLDYDYSSMTLEPPNRSMAVDVIPPRFPLFPLESLGQNDPENVADLKERTGTYYFIALELLRAGTEPVVHDSHHDLESFYWVLLWIVLRHTAHNSPEGKETCSLVFKFGNDREASTAKGGWLYNVEAPLKIDKNPPLTHLMAQLQDLVFDAALPRWRRSKPLTYRAFLDIFDAAIEREDWPTNDPALPFIPPKPTDMPTVIEGALPSCQVKRPFEFINEFASGPSGIASIESSPSSRASAKRQRAAATPLASGSGAPSENGGAASTSRTTARKRGRGARGSKTTSGRDKASGGRPGKASGGRSGKASGGGSGKGSGAGKAPAM